MTAKKPTPAKKVAVTVKLTSETVKKARSAAYWTPGTTMSSLIEDALVRELARLERSRGGPFPDKAVQLKSGRPVKL